MDGLKETIFAQQNIYRAAMSNSPAQRKLDAILRAYEYALRDPNAVLPTALMCAIEAARA